MDLHSRQVPLNPAVEAARVQERVVQGVGSVGGGDVGGAGSFWGEVSAALMLVVLLVTSLPPVLVFVGGVGSVSTPFLLPQLPMAAVRRGGEFGWEAWRQGEDSSRNKINQLSLHSFTASVSRMA